VQGSDIRVPSPAAWLGGLGAVPFVALALALVVPSIAAAPRAGLAPALVAYGAVILSFLGAVHWGLAIAPAPTVGSPGPALLLRLGGSVLPSLAGWGALLLPTVPGLVALAGAFAAMLVIDRRAAQIGAAPAWYPKLRLPLSLVAIASLLLAAAAVAARVP